MKGIALYGGLGDGLITIHESTGYESLEKLGPDERARVYIISHNPFAEEIFRWHPKASQIDVFKAKFFFTDYANERIRAEAGIPPEPLDPCEPRPLAPVRFHASPMDLAILEQRLPKRPFLAVAPTASGMEIENRNIPLNILSATTALARTYGIPVVFLGRTYQGPHAPKLAPSLPSGRGVVNLTDCLSVPGTIEVVKRATAVLSAHSCLLLLSWYERKPVFALYPLKYKQHDFDRPSPFGFGKNYPECTRMLFGEFKPNHMRAFLDTHVRPKM